MSGISDVLEKLKSGELSVSQAEEELKNHSYSDIGYAKVDMSRESRQGASEVIYGEGKTAGQIIGIIDAMRAGGQEHILATRVDAMKAEKILQSCVDTEYFPEARCIIAGGYKEPDGIGTVLVATGGTSDIPAAEEAAVTARFLGNNVERLYDVGVAGIHRLLSHTDSIMNASVIIAAAGMEGALPSVIGGLAKCPVIALPTSVGYGASLGGISALLSMLNCCAAGVTVVNIDNGFGAGFAASRINHVTKTERTE